jgi:hypothetical protein
MGRPNPQNLKVPTSEEARRNGRKGGLKRAENARKERSFQDMARGFLSGVIDEPEARKKIIEITGSEDLADQEGLIFLGMMLEAQGGNVQASKLIWDRVYGNAPQNINMKHEIDSDAIQSIFDSVAGKGDGDE